MITFRKIKAHFLTLCARFKKQAVLVLKYLIGHPFKFLMALVALFVLIAAVYAIEYFIAGQSLKSTTSPKTVQAQAEQTPSLPDKPKKFGKNITLHHATPKPKVVANNDIKTEELPQKNENQDIEEPVKYPVWDIKQPLKKTEPVLEAKEEVLLSPTEQNEDFPVIEEVVIDTPEEIIETAEIVPEVKENTSVVNVQEKTPELEEQAPALLLYRKVEGLGLSYLKAPIMIEGDAVIYGPNELYVKDTYLYLYGIYTDPIKYDTQEVTQYIRDFVTSQKLQCLIVAYTSEGVATGLCFKGDDNLNQMLVDKNMADNVAL